MSQGTMAQRIVIPERRSSSMYTTGLQHTSKPHVPTTATTPMAASASMDRNTSPPPRYSKSVLRTPSQTGGQSASATAAPPASTAVDGTSQSNGGDVAEPSPKAAAALSLSGPLQTSTLSTPQRETVALPSTPPANRRLAAVRSSTSLTIDRGTSSRSPMSQASGSEFPKRPPLDSTQSSPNLSIRSMGSPRSLPPQSEPPMSPIPPTPDRAPSRTQPSSPRRMIAPPSPRSTKSSQLSELVMSTSRDDDEAVDPLTSVRLTRASPTKAGGSPLPSPTSLLFSDSQGGPSSSAGLFAPRLEPPPRPVMAASRRGSDSRATSTLGPPLSDRRPSGSSLHQDVRRGSASSLPMSPAMNHSTSRLAEQRRGSLASVSSTSTFRVRRKPTPSEFGDDIPMSPRSGSLTGEDSAPISELRRGSTGSRDSRQGPPQAASSLSRHLQPLAEAQTPSVADGRMDFISKVPSATHSDAAAPISTVMVDGQAFVLGDNSPAKASPKAPRAVSSSHESALAQRSPLAGGKTAAVSRGTAARQQAIAVSMARSASMGHDRAMPATSGTGSSSGVQRSSSGRTKGLGDGRGFARRPGGGGNAAINPSLSKRNASAATEGIRDPSAGANEVGEAGDLSLDQEDAAAGSYAIDPPTEEALAQAASLMLFTETGELQQFGEIFAKQRTLVCFLRHWFCPMCQEYAMSMANLDPLPLQRANLGMIVVGQGHPHVLAAYKRVMGVPDWIQMYADPSRKIYHALGMTKRTNDPGPACAKPDYITMSMMKGSMQAVKKGLFQMPVRLPGDTKLLGGEFIFGPGLQTSFTHRMVTTRGHFDVPRILVQAGCDMSLKTPTAIDRERSQSKGTRSVSRSTTRRRASHNTRKASKRYGGSDRLRSVTTPVGKRKDGSVMKRRSSGQVPAVPRVPLSALFATGLDGTPARRNVSGDSALKSSLRQPSASVDQPRVQRSYETQVSPSNGRRRPSTAPDPVEGADTSGLSGAGKSADLTQEEIRERQRKAFAAGPSNSPAGPNSDTLHKANDGQLRHSFDRSASLSRSGVGRTPSQSRRQQGSKTVDSALSRTPSLSKQSPANRRTQFVTPSREEKESMYGTPASAFAINSDSPLVQELRRSLSRHEPSSDLDDDAASGKGAKLVRQVTQSRRPEVITPTQIIEPETVVTDGKDAEIERSPTPTEQLRSASALSATHDIGTSTPRQDGLPRKISHRQLWLEGGAPSTRSVGSPPATPKSASLKLMRDSTGALPGLFNSPTRRSTALPASPRDSLYSAPRLREAEHAAAAASTPIVAQGETAHIDSWSDEEGESGDTSIADELEQHEQAIRHQSSMGSLTSSRLSSPRKGAPALPSQPEAVTYAGMTSSKTVMPGNRFESSTVTGGNGGGASFLDELDMIDGFVRSARHPRDRGSADDMPRYSFESSLGEEEEGEAETEPADSDSDMEHESGWVRPRSSRSISSSRRSGYSQSNGRSAGVRASQDSNFSPDSLNESLDEVRSAPRLRGLGALTPTRPSFQSSRRSEDTDLSYEDQAGDNGDESFRTTSMGRSVQQSGDEDDADYESAVDEEDRPGRESAPSGNRSRASTPHRNGQLTALVEGEEEA